MKITQEAWDHLWETSTGEQKKMFDESGYRPEPIDYRGWAAYLKQPSPYLKFPILKATLPPWAVK
jgi:hypothetical protein